MRNRRYRSYGMHAIVKNHPTRNINRHKKWTRKVALKAKKDSRRAGTKASAWNLFKSRQKYGIY